MGGDCKRVVAVMDSSTTAATSQSKRLKLDFDFEEIKHKHSPPSSSFHRLIAVSSSASSATSENSERFLTGDAYSADSPPSFCSSNEESTEAVKDSSRLLDLQSFETESKTNIHSNFSREASPCSSEVCGDEMETPAETRRIREVTAAEKLPSPPSQPSKEEIEEFFAEAEEGERKRFEERYNYDVGKDAPLEGRYQWVCLTP